jgi:hypothetical protein
MEYKRGLLLLQIRSPGAPFFCGWARLSKQACKAQGLNRGTGGEAALEELPPRAASTALEYGIQANACSPPILELCSSFNFLTIKSRLLVTNLSCAASKSSRGRRSFTMEMEIPMVVTAKSRLQRQYKRYHDERWTDPHLSNDVLRNYKKRVIGSSHLTLKCH